MSQTVPAVSLYCPERGSFLPQQPRPPKAQSEGKRTTRPSLNTIFCSGVPGFPSPESRRPETPKDKPLSPYLKGWALQGSCFPSRLTLEKRFQQDADQSFPHAVGFQPVPDPSRAGAASQDVGSRHGAERAWMSSRYAPGEGEVSRAASMPMGLEGSLCKSHLNAAFHSGAGTEEKRAKFRIPH